MAIPRKLLVRFFCQVPSVLIADISPPNVQEECTRGLLGFDFFFFLNTDLVLKEGKIVFIEEVLKAVNLKCFSLPHYIHL